MRGILGLVLGLWTAAASAAGLTIDTTSTPAEWDAPASVDVLVFSSWVRVPRSGAAFASPSLQLDGGGELFVRLDGSRVLLLDDFDDSIDGGDGWPHIATGTDGALRQWNAGTSTWTVSGVADDQPTPPGIVNDGDVVLWLSFLSAEVAMLIGCAWLSLLLASWWRNKVEF